MANQDFKIKTGEFEGPLDLLLNLIEKRKLHISQISLAQVADDYVTYLKNRDTESMSALANFIMVASTLMLIKSLALLPGLQLTEEETGSVIDLEKRLKYLQRIRQLSRHLKENFDNTIIFTPRDRRPQIIVFSPTKELTQPQLVVTIKNLLKNLPRPEILPQKVIQKVISLEEVISDLARRVNQAIRLSFNDFVKDQSKKINVIVSFLGMLELVKQGAIEIEQKAHFADIAMETKVVGVPRY